MLYNWQDDYSSNETMTTDTPRTHAAKVDKVGMTFVWVEFAEELERENNKLRKIVEGYRVWATSENPTQIELDDLKQKYDEIN